MTIQNVESLQERYERYQKAKARIENWKPLLEEAYKFIFPNRESFYSATPGESKSDEIFDETAIIGGIQFANNLQSLLMPPYRKWVEIVAGDLLTTSSVVNDDEIKEINEKLQNDTDTLFRNLESSNFNYVMNEAFQDVCIGTSVIALNEGNLNQPFEFMCIPIKDICFEEDVDGNIESFWHIIEISVRDIKRKWPNAVLTPSLQNLLNTNPNERVKLIEGSIYVPENDLDSKYAYYISTENGEEQIVATQFREFSPFTAARYSKMPGEIWGRGVGLMGLSLIKVLNKMKEFILRSAKLKAFPVYMAASGGVLNPFNISIEPGAIIPFDATATGGQAPIIPIPNSGDPNFMQMSINDMQNTLRELFFANPLGQPGNSPDQTATEVSLRQQNFMRQNGAAIGRLAYEFIVPLINKCLIILRRKGLIRDIDTSLGKQSIQIDNKVVTLKYSSPLLNVQNQEDVQNLTQYISMIMQTFGPNALLALDIFKIPMTIAEKMNIDLDLVKNESEIREAFQQMQQNIQQQQEQGQIQPSLAQGQGGAQQSQGGMQQGGGQPQ